MKKQMLIILLLTLLTGRITCEPRNDSEKSLEMMQKTSQKLFSEDEVLVLVEQLKAKAQEAISNAYDEGYKAGLKEYAPQLEAERFKVSQLEIQNKKLKSQTRQTPWFTIAGTSAGVFTGFIIKGLIDMGGR